MGVRSFLSRLRLRMLGGSIAELKAELEAIRLAANSTQRIKPAVASEDGAIAEQLNAARLESMSLTAQLSAAKSEAASLKHALEEKKALLSAYEAEITAIRAELDLQIAEFELHRADKNNDHWNSRVKYDDKISNLQLDLADLYYPGNRARLKDLYLSHVGETCFIIGNDSGLKPDALELLRENGVYCFASDDIQSIFSQTRWRPNAWTTSDPMNFINNEKEQCELEEIEKWLPCDVAIEQNAQLESAIYYPHVSTKRIPFYFNMDIRGGVYSYIPAVGILINIAAFMGFTKIYLMGIDGMHIKYEESVVILRDIKLHCEAVGINLYTTTPDGVLDMFEYVE